MFNACTRERNDGGNFMYKKYTTLFLLYNMVLFMAWICAKGVIINKKAVEAFTVAEEEAELQAIGFLGVAQEKVSEKRVLTTNVITKKDKAGYMPEVENITLKLVADRRSHRILGAQAIGCGDADKKINNISIGLSHRVTVENLLDIDFTYAPPFSTSVDILHSAARMLKSKLN